MKSNPLEDPSFARNRMRRVFWLYALAALIMSIYGGKICPYIESLSWWIITLQCFGGFFVAYLVRVGVQQLILSRNQRATSSNLFLLDVACFLLAGLLFGGVDSLIWTFPVESMFKVMLGCLTLGLLLGMDMALAHERKTFMWILENNHRPEAPSSFTSLARTFVVFAITVGIVITIDVLLVVFKDLRWIVTQGEEGLRQAQIAVATEISFVVIILMALTLRVLVSYARNLQLLFDDELHVLEQVSAGNLDRYVQLYAGNELGRIAKHTNTMIDELRERARLRELFGKVVSPDVASLLLQEGGSQLGGARHEVVVLFSDVRGFTSRTERQDPEILIEDLNHYFSAMVKIVHEQHGVVDKFIGDGMMAVFGLHAGEDSSEHAVRAALAMLEAVEELNEVLSEPMKIGIGLHRGDVIAGNIGAEERLEFTFIGDTVNIAARFESLCKDLDTTIVTSNKVHEALPPDLQGHFEDRGEHKVKGKANALRVYGLYVDEK